MPYHTKQNDLILECLRSRPGHMTAQDVMKTYYQLLQEDIEAVPWNYLWTHKRWKA